MPTGWADTSWEEEYFTTIPEDITILNSSLSSSLSSLCAGRGDLEGAREASSEVTLIPAVFFCVCINFCENSESRFGDVCILFSKLLTFFHTLQYYQHFTLVNLLTSNNVMYVNHSQQVDKLKHIRKEAASRKAQLLSAATSASNSPECSRQSSGETRGHPSNQELARGRPSNQGEM